MLTSDFDYELPPELIAQHPLSQRSASRLLYIPKNAGFEGQSFSDLPQMLSPGDLLVFNDSRVFPARLYGRKTSGGQVEILIERLIGTHCALAHIRASKALKPGGKLLLPENVQAEVVARKDDLFELEFHCPAGSLLDYLQRAGQIPLPPYITRAAELADRERYQTVYARSVGAVAAPTAGLHFDQPVFEKLRNRGIECVYVTLHVGAGTFQPVRTEQIQDHRMHSETVEVSADVCLRIKETVARGGRIVAVGTTVVRSLEAAAADGELKPFAGETRLFITPGYRFRIVDLLLTNFHLPRSSLLMLVCAFGGYERVMRAYRHAVEQRYRFFSYGDAMLLHKAVV